MRFRRVLAVAFTLAAVPALAAAQASPSLRNAVVCAPGAPADPTGAPRILGAQDSPGRTLFGTKDRLILNAGTNKGLQPGQRYATRRVVSTRSLQSGQSAVVTSGLVTIVAATEQTAIALVDFACGGVEKDDYLVAWTEPSIPADADRNDAGGDLDFSSPARILFGDNGRASAGAGDLVVIDAGQKQNIAPGGRFAIFRDVRTGGVPLSAVGEAVVVSVSQDTSVVRLTRTVDAIQAGDLLIPRKR